MLLSFKIQLAGENSVPGFMVVAGIEKIDRVFSERREFRLMILSELQGVTLSIFI